MGAEQGDPLAYPEPDPIGPYLPGPFPGMQPTPPVPVPWQVSLADLAPTVAAGIIGATEVNNGTHRVYQVVFEENEDGRLRANVTMYQLGYNEDNDVIIHAQHLWVGEDGELMQQPISYGDPYGSTMEMLPAPGSDVPASQFEGRDYRPGSLPRTAFP